MFIKYLYQMDNILKLSNIKNDTTVQQRWDKIANLGYSIVPYSIAKKYNLLKLDNAFDTGLETIVKFEGNDPIAPLETSDGIPYLKFKNNIHDNDIGEIMVKMDDYGDFRVDKILAMKDMTFDDSFSINEWKKGAERFNDRETRNLRNDYKSTVQQVAKKLNVEVSKVLGKGENGIAYLLTNGNVLKLTKDLSEVIESNKLLKKPTKHIAQIYSVFKLNTSMSHMNPGKDEQFKGVIISEFVTVNRPFFIHIINTMDNLYEDLYPDEFDSLDDVLMNYILKSDEAHIKTFNSVENTLLANCSDEYKKPISDIFNIYRELKMNGSKSVDVHAGNLGFDKNNNIKYFDLGIGEIFTNSKINKLKVK